MWLSLFIIRIWKIDYHELQKSLSNLTAEEFKRAVEAATMGGNSDFPEATLDALMQAMVSIWKLMDFKNFLFLLVLSKHLTWMN